MAQKVRKKEIHNSCKNRATKQRHKKVNLTQERDTNIKKIIERVEEENRISLSIKHL